MCRQADSHVLSDHYFPAVVQDELCQRVVSEPDVTKRSLVRGASLSSFSADAFFVVIQGAVAVELLGDDGELTTLEVLVPGDCAPNWPESKPPTHQIGLRAMVPSSVARVPLTTFARVMQSDPALASAFGSKLAQQHTELLTRLAETVQRSALRRVSAAVGYLAQKLGLGCPLASGIRIPLPQSEIANVANHTRQTTNDAMRQLQAAGLIHVERSMVCVLDRERLGAIAQGADLQPTWEPAKTCQFTDPDEVLTCYPLRRASPALGTGSG